MSTNVVTSVIRSYTVDTAFISGIIYRCSNIHKSIPLYLYNIPVLQNCYSGCILVSSKETNTQARKGKEVHHVYYRRY